MANDELIQVLAAVADHLGEEGRSALMPLLPEELRQPLAAVESPSGGLADAAVGALLQGGNVDDGPAAQPLTMVGAVLGLLVAEAETELAVQFLAVLPSGAQGLMLQSLSAETLSDATKGLRVAERELVKELAGNLLEDKRWGKAAAIDIVRGLADDHLTAGALEAVAAVDAAAHGRLQDRLFAFENLMRLRDPELQVLMS